MFFALLIGIGLLAYPTVSDYWNSFHQSRAVATYVEKVANLNNEEFDRMWAEAEAYNADLVNAEQRYILTDEERQRYMNTLDITGTGIMGYIDIPRINISLPVYHGTDESVLQIAIGHIAGTSLPVGGLTTHCVVSGHRGLPSAKLFTNLDQMVEGDIFLLQILDRTLTYEVDQIRIVLPSELQDLEIENGQDYCTLVTCTPYGINSHRLLVRGHRIENERGPVRVTADAVQFSPILMSPFFAGILIFILLTFLILGHRDRRR